MFALTLLLLEFQRFSLMDVPNEQWLLRWQRQSPKLNQEAEADSWERHMTALQCEERTFTREEFYDFVWSARATQLAKELGCSTYALRKICEEYDVPTPYNGYWSRVATGKSPARTDLPPRPDGESHALKVYRIPGGECSFNEPPRELNYDREILEILEKARQLDTVSVPLALRSPHRLVASTKTQLEENARHVKKDKWLERRGGLVGPGDLSIEVGVGQMGRALRIMDALVKRIEAIGGEIIPRRRAEEYDRRNGTMVRFLDEDITEIRLREKLKHVRITDPNEKYEWNRHRTEYVQTGLLLVDKGPSSFDPPMIIDSPSRKLEDGLSHLIVELVVLAAEQRLRSRELAEEERRRAEQARIEHERRQAIRQKRAELEQRQATEQSKVDQLVNWATSWQKSRLIREYLDVLCETAGGASYVTLDSRLAEYLQWGFGVADRLDPLRPTPPSVLDETIDESETFAPPKKPR